MPPTLLRLLRLHDAAPAERRAASWTAALFFCVLFSYYLLRPVREEIGAGFGPQHLWPLFVLTFVLVALLNVPYMWLANRMPMARFLPLVLHGFALSFVVLALALGLLPRPGPTPQWAEPATLVGAFLYSWVTAFVVCGVALVWVHAVDFFGSQQGRRLFGFVSVGGSLGAIGGSALAWSTAALPRWSLVALAVLALELAVLCYGRSRAACQEMVGPRAPAHGGIASAGVLEGLRLIARSRYLLAMAAFTIFGSILATAFYYTLNGLAREQIADSADRRGLFALINLLQNTITLLLQVWVTRAVLLRLGLAAVLCLMPAISLGGLALAALWPVVAVMAAFEVARRTLQYAFDKPAREVLYTPLGREEKYKSKAFLDTTVLRCGDLVGAWLNDLLVRAHAGAASIAAWGAPVVLVWGVVGIWLGRRCRALEALRGADEAACGSTATSGPRSR